MVALSRRSWLGIARESTSGIAVTTPALYIPTKSTMKNVKKREYLNEERGSRDKDYDVVDTTRNATWDVKGPFYPDAHGYFLFGALGAVSTSVTSDASGNVHKHVFSLADIPPSFTLMKSFDSKTYYSAYSMVEKFTIKLSGAEKLIECDASGQGLWMVEKSSPPTPTFSSARPFAGYAPQITLNGGISTDIDDIEIDFEQKMKLYYPASGVPDFITIYPGEREVKFKYTARFDNDNLYKLYLNGQMDSLSFDVQGRSIGTSSHEELNITLETISYDSMEHDLGKENVLIKASGKALGGSSNLIAAYVQNLLSSY
jgi:hypothetical protein